MNVKCMVSSSSEKVKYEMLYSHAYYAYYELIPIINFLPGPRKVKIKLLKF